MGNIYSFVTEAFPPKSLFSVKDIVDLSGRVAIVTGANTGVGKEIAKALLLHNAKVYIAARSAEKAIAAIEDLETLTGKKATFLKVNLADLPTIKAGAEEFLGQEKELHMLFNNAGVMMPPIDLVTEQNYDLQFGTNVLGHFYLTQLLLPALLAGAKSSPDGTARVVNVSSSGHLGGSLDFNTFKDSPKRRKSGTHNMYFQSKFGNIVFSNELARRYGDQGIVSTSLNPGNLRTELARHQPPIFMTIFGWAIFHASYGALSPLYAGTTAAGAELNGKYLIPWACVGQPLAATQDPALGKQLWEWAEEQVANV